MKTRKSDLPYLKKMLAKLDATADPGLSIGEARRRREIAEARIAELSLGQKEGTLLDADRARDAWTSLIIEARERFMGIGAELADRVAASSDPIAIREMIHERICQALEEWSQWPPEKAKPAGKSKPRKAPAKKPEK